MEPLLIGRGDVAHLLGVSSRLICTMDASGHMPRPIRLGRRVLWRVEELRLWTQAGCPPRTRWEAESRELWLPAHPGRPERS